MSALHVWPTSAPGLAIADKEEGVGPEDYDRSESARRVGVWIRDRIIALDAASAIPPA